MNLSLFEYLLLFLIVSFYSLAITSAYTNEKKKEIRCLWDIEKEG
jgi:hypothetical protein